MSEYLQKTRTNQNSLVEKVFSPFGQYSVEAPFAGMTATSLLGRYLPALYSEMVKFLSILHVKIALVLPSLMGIVDGLQSSSLTKNVQLGSSQDFHWTTQEHLFTSYSGTQVWLLVCVSDHYTTEM